MELSSSTAKTILSFDGIYVSYKNQSLWQAVKAHRDVRRRGCHLSKQSTPRLLWSHSYAPLAFEPQKDSWYLFLLEVESTPEL
jgi:hypothetical protein